MPFLDATVRHGAYLPHWRKDGATYHVRFRLSDSLPQHVLQSWREEKAELIDRITKEKRKLTRLEQERLSELASEKVQQFLRAGYGACHLKNDRIAQVMADALRSLHNKQYRLRAWCIMPNHVHVIVEPIDAWSLDRILRYWKRTVARKANRLLGRTGAFWQEESFDHLIRDEAGFHGAVRYVWNNPEEAGLKHWRWRWVAKDACEDEIL